MQRFDEDCFLNQRLDVMRPHSRLTVLSLFALLALPTWSIAQEPKEPENFMMPLRADKVIADSTKDVAFIQGNIDWPNGRTTATVQITCMGSSRSLFVKDGLNIATWAIEPGFCDVLARSVQRRN
jgi:hypothetical protein